MSDLIEWVLKMFPEDVADELAKDVCVTGGLANLPGLKERMTSQLIEVSSAIVFVSIAMQLEVV